MQAWNFKMCSVFFSMLANLHFRAFPVNPIIQNSKTSSVSKIAGKAFRTSFARFEAKSSGSSSLAEGWVDGHFWGGRALQKFFRSGDFFVHQKPTCFARNFACRIKTMIRIKNHMCRGAAMMLLPACMPRSSPWTWAAPPLREGPVKVEAMWRMTTVAGRGKHRHINF